jgi:hypothetical protein
LTGRGNLLVHDGNKKWSPCTLRSTKGTISKANVTTYKKAASVFARFQKEKVFLEMIGQAFTNLDCGVDVFKTNYPGMFLMKPNSGIVPPKLSEASYKVTNDLTNQIDYLANEGRESLLAKQVE